jgi:2'-5' RNA ligase
MSKQGKENHKTGYITLSNKNIYVELSFPLELRDELTTINTVITTEIPNYNPMSYQGLHMSIAYIGDIANYAKSVNKSVKALLAELNDVLTEFNNRGPLSSLQFKGYDLFSEKRNLIVARYKINHDEYSCVLDLKKTCAKLFGAPVESDFEPHITMGKIQNCNDTNRSGLDKLSAIPRVESAVITLDDPESGLVKLAN